MTSMSDKFEVADHNFFGIQRPDGSEVEVRQEFDGSGNHRIKVGDFMSEYSSYTGIAYLETPNGTYMGTSEYYTGFPRVWQVLPGVELISLFLRLTTQVLSVVVQWVVIRDQ